MKLSEYNRYNAQTQSIPALTHYVIYCRKSSESDERQIQSLSDQITTLLPFVKQRCLLVVGEPLQESKSAKSPGRPLFNQMVEMIEKGQANGIILLNPTRLSRNTVDTGQIIFLMDQGKLEEVVTPYQTFKNNPYDKFMLNLLCTQAKLENDNKSVNVRDSMRLKAERGDFPGLARPGYINNRLKNQGMRDISAHPVYFSLMRKLFDFALTGNYSVKALVKKAEELGIRNYNGSVIQKSSWHRFLRDPFYTGKFVYKGKLYQGKHPALLTEEEFNLLQNVLDGRSKGKRQKYEFALNGTMKCGECQYCITAETHIKHYKNGTSQTFAYYRCSKQSQKMKCSQGYLPGTKAETQVKNDLIELNLEKEFEQWAFEALEESIDKDQTVITDKITALQTALDGVNKRISNLTDLKISPNNVNGTLFSDEEFAERKRALLIEKDKILEQIKNGSKDEAADTLARESFNFGLNAYRRFLSNHPEDKKVIVKSIYSNLILLNQNLQFQPRYLFFKYKEGIRQTNEEKSRLEPMSSLNYQDNLEFKVKNDIWYARRESNPQPND